MVWLRRNSDMIAISIEVILLIIATIFGYAQNKLIFFVFEVCILILEIARSAIMKLSRRINNVTIALFTCEFVISIALVTMLIMG